MIDNNVMTLEVAAVDGSKHRAQVSCMEYRVVIEAGEDEGFVAMCPSLLGCTSQGRTPVEALANIKDVMTGYLASLKEQGAPA
jgi:predicted RNase H-like HicB family nuclease